MSFVTCIGILVADLMGRPINRFPERGKLLLVPEMELHVGGCAHNTAVDLRKLGEEVLVVGKVGDDDLGDVVINSLKRHGVDVRGVTRDPRFHTSATMVLLDDRGERTFLHYPGANQALRASDVKDEFLRGAKVVHVAGSFLMPGFDGEETAKVFARAREFGVLTSLDTAWDDTGRWFATIAPVLPLVDVFISNRDEAARISGKSTLADIASFFLGYGAKVVAIKMGEEGSFIMTKEEKILVPPFKVTAVDGTGAGDAFAAGFLFGYLRGWELYEVGRFANACGAMCVERMGATEGVGSFEEVQRFIKEHEAKLG